MTKLIVARSANNVIGKDNDLIWHLPADMRFFTQSTLGHVVIMGRRNWDSIPAKYRPLKDRLNVVVTRNKDFTHSDCVTFHSLKEAVEAYKSDAQRETFIIGGGQIYKEALDQNLVDEMYITEIENEFDGDTWFPQFDEKLWTKELILDHPKDDKNNWNFKVWKYRKVNS